MTLILEDNEILTVDGMACQGCESRIENTLNNLEGVWAKANASTKKLPY